VHLPGKAYAGDVFAGEARGSKRLARGNASGPPPVLGLLLGPANLWRCKGLVVFGRGRDQAASLIDYDRASAACSDINSEDVDRASSRTLEQKCANHHIQPEEDGKRLADEATAQRIDTRETTKISLLRWS